MSGHTPKTAALLAYDADLLSVAGRTRLEAHLAGCEVCRRELRAVRLYDQMVAEAQAETVEIEWDRMELALRREARDVSAQVRAERMRGKEQGARVSSGPPDTTWLLAGMLAAAAAVLALWSMRSGESPTASLGTERSATVAPIDTPPVAGEITLVSGRGLRRTFAGTEGLAVGAAVSEADTLEANGDSRIHVRFREGTGIVVGAESQVRVRRLRAADVSIDLVNGTVASVVAPLARRHTYDIHLDPWRVEVRGTRFSVTRDGAGIVVRLEEGAVAIFRHGTLVRVLEAPAVFGASGDAQSPMPFGLGASDADWPTLALPDLGMTEWQIDGASFEAPSGGALRVAPGTHTVIGLRDGIEALRTRIDVVDDHVLEGPASVAPQAPARRYGDLPAALLVPVVEAGRPALMRCQESVSRSGPATVSGRFTLEVTVSPSGAVSQARLVPAGAAPPPEFTRCVESKVREWVFPPPSGAGFFRFEAPLRFGSRAPNLQQVP
jgi:hypothetical protein